MSDSLNSDNQAGEQQYYPRYDTQTGEPLHQSAASPSSSGAGYGAAPRGVSAAVTVPTKKGGGLKTFLLGFLGAALACVLTLSCYHALFAYDTSSVGSESSVTLGAGTSSSITVTGDDANLAEVVAEKTTPSVCCIYVYSRQSSSFPYGFGSNSSSDTLSQSSLGSGVILTEDGYVLTNYHVVEDADALKVSAGGQEYDATLVGADESSDLAVIKLTGAANLTPIAVGDSDKLTTGEWVMTIGSPFGLESSVATGIVSATSRSQIMDSSNSSSSTTTIYANLIQTDAAINPGNSGGALVDAQGNLIGINTLITSYSGNYSGVGFAIPVNYAIEIANTIIKGEVPSHAQLGVTLVSVTDSLAQRYGLPVSSGAYLSSVSAGSGAEEAGLSVGDIITKVDDTTVSSASDLMIAIRKHSPGDTITVTYNRDGQTKTAEVTLGSDASTTTQGSLLFKDSSADA